MEQLTGSSGSRWRGALLWLRPAAAVALLVVLFSFVPVGAVWEQLHRARPAPLAVSVLLVFAAMLVSSLKLWLLVRVAHPAAGLGPVLRAYYVGAFINNFLPTIVGGDVVKVGELRRSGISLSHAAAGVVTERGAGLAVVFALALIVPIGFGGLLERLGLEAARWPLAAFGLGGLALPVVLYAAWRTKLKAALEARRNHRVFGRLYGLAESFYVFRNHPASLLCALGLSVVFYALLALNIAVVARAVGGAVTVPEAVGILPLRTLPDLVPISLGSLGVREGVVTYCLAGLGMEPARAAAAALMLRAVGWLHSAFGGCLYAFRQATARREPAR